MKQIYCWQWGISKYYASTKATQNGDLPIHYYPTCLHITYTRVECCVFWCFLWKFRIEISPVFVQNL